MIHGIGTDIVRVDRIRASLARFGEHFARRILTPAELTELAAQRYPERFVAKRFAAKEAAVKALGCGFRHGIGPSSIGIVHDRWGKPELAYLGAALDQVRETGVSASLISLSDERDYAVAFVVLLRAP